MSNKSQRLTWRARCRRWQRYISALLAVQAQTTVRCTRSTQPGFYRVNGSGGARTVGVCYVWRPRGVLP